MNIVFLSPFWPQGANANGIITYCANMVPALKALGHNVYVLTSNVAAEGCADVYSLDYKASLFEKIWCAFVERFNKGYSQYYFGSRALLAGVKKIQKDHKVDVFELEESFGWHYFLQKKLPFPVVMRLHGPHYINGTMSNKELGAADFNRFKREERAFKAARYVNAPCEWVLNNVKDKYQIAWPLSSVFYNPIEPVQEVDCWSSSSYTAQQILFVGRFDSHKGGDLVIASFAKVLEVFPLARLVFVGPDRGFEMSSGKKISVDDCIRLNIPEGKRSQVEYLGLVGKDKIVSLRKQSHITVIASRNENFPYSVLESLASAAPTVASFVGGITEVFEDNVSGVYFEGSNVEDFASKIIGLLGDDEKIQSLSRNSYKRCLDMFSSPKVAVDAVDFYNKALSLHCDLV